MPSITVKNIPEKIFKHLKERAALHHRSINSEIIYLIENATCAKGIDADVHLKKVQGIRNKMKYHPVSDTEISTAKNEGRE